MLLVLLLAGCGTTPPVSYYTLPSDPAPQSATSPREYSVAVGPVTVPDAVDRPQLVLRTSATRVEVVELARWAAPLKHEIPRVVAQHLARLLPGAATATSAERAMNAPDYRVVIDIQRFDSAPNESAAIEAAWTVRGAGGVSRSGRSVATETSAAGHAALVEAHGRALAAISRDIAAAITALQAAAAK